jgi:capsid protein
MSKSRPAILDSSGKPFPAASRRREMADMGRGRRPRIRGSYDAAQDLQDTSNHWASADSHDADSANSRAVRAKLVPRARYEIQNNGYSDGIATTYADDLVGIGPQLRMQTSSDAFNRLVEQQWFLWTKAVQFRRKLWCAAHAKHSDGESIGVIRRNPGVTHPVPLDWCLYETEQCQTPFLPFGERGYIDGIKFDQFGNAVWYDILEEHPGSNHRANYNLTPERVPAEFVTHWFKLRRPGQHRGIPETTSTLNLGAASRRWRESTLAHAEMIAKLTVLLKSLMEPAAEDADPVTAMSQLELLAGTMIALPNTVEPVQLDAKQPAATYSMFHKALVNEQARPKSMPYNKAACDSSEYNYASGRLDHQTYNKTLDVERADCDELVLDKVFAQWFMFAVRRFQWLGGEPTSLANVMRLHAWDWPKHGVVDIEAEANANQTKLQSGQVFLHAIYTDAGQDFEDELEKAAISYGVTPDVLRKRLLDVILPPVQQAAPPPAPKSPTNGDAAVDGFAATLRCNGHANGVHVNGG